MADIFEVLERYDLMIVPDVLVCYELSRFSDVLLHYDLSGFSDVSVHHDLFMFSDQVRRPCDYDELSSDDQPRKPDTTSPRRAKYEEFFDNSDAGSTSESRRKNSSNSLRTHAFVICLLFVYAVLSI